MKAHEEEISKREVYQEVHNPHTHSTEIKKTSTVENSTMKNSKKAAYQDGYVQGRVVENSLQNDYKRVRDNDNAARGLMLGIGLTSLVGLAVGAVYFLNQREEAPAPQVIPQVITVPKANDPSPAPSQSRTIEKQKTIIEKIVPVPQPSPVQPVQKAVPAPQPPSPAPNINITVPNSQRQEAPREQPKSAPAPAPATPSNNINITVPTSPQESTGKASKISPAPSPALKEGAPDSGSSSGNQTDTPSNSKAGDSGATEGNNSDGSSPESSAQ